MITLGAKMETKKFRFEGFQQDTFGGAFPLFTVFTEVWNKKLLRRVETFGTTLSGRGIFEMGYIVPAFPILKDTAKGEIFEFEQRKTIDISSKDRLSK